MKEKLKLIKLTDTHYIVIDNFLIKDVRPYIGRYHYEKGVAINQFPTYLTDLSECKLIIYSTEPLEGVENISLKNCQAIEHGYDLDEILKDYGFVKPYDKYDEYGIIHFKAGFQKALELMGVKKFTEEDVRKAMYRVWDWCEDDKDEDCSSMTELRDKHIQSLQQKEWNVEIEMEEVAIGDKYTPSPKPKLDQDGYITLKRVI